ncbi:hypothetical protein D3C77_587080 [compost metagenome]
MAFGSLVPMPRRNQRGFPERPPVLPLDWPERLGARRSMSEEVVMSLSRIA